MFAVVKGFAARVDGALPNILPAVLVGAPKPVAGTNGLLTMKPPPFPLPKGPAADVEPGAPKGACIVLAGALIVFG